MSTAVDATPVDARRHTLMVADDDRSQRASTAAWVAQALATGEEVYYKGWHDPAAPPQTHWLAGRDGVRGATDALRSGQLELADYGTVLDAAGGTNDGVRRYHTEEIERALDEGWSSVAMAHETVKRPMAEASEAVEVAEHEAGYDILMDQWPLRVLCQLTVAEENQAAAWETVAMHHRDVLDGPWAASTFDGVWYPKGQIDAYVARRFGAAAHGALHLARTIGPDPDLHIDTSGVGFIDVTSVEILLLVARSAPAGQRVVLHRPTRMVRRLVDALGRPPSVVWGDLR